MKPESRILIVVWMAIAFVIVFASGARAAESTPDTVMTTAGQGSVLSADAFIAVNEANSFLNRLATDKGYATKFLETIRTNNPNEVISVVKQTAPRSQVSVEKLNPDFDAVLIIKTRAIAVNVCLSNRQGCPGHTNSSIRFQ